MRGSGYQKAIGPGFMAARGSAAEVQKKRNLLGGRGKVKIKDREKKKGVILIGGGD